MEQGEEYWARSQKVLSSHLLTGSAVQRKSVWSENQNRWEGGEENPILFVPNPLLILGKTAPCHWLYLQTRIWNSVWKSGTWGHRGPVNSISCPAYLSICFLWFSTSCSKACFSDSLSCSLAICSSSLGRKRQKTQPNRCHLQPGRPPTPHTHLPSARGRISSH